MFDSIRSHRRWLMFFMLVLIFPSFVFFGIQGYNRFIEQEGALATVDGKSRSRSVTSTSRSASGYERLRQQFGAEFDPEGARHAGGPRRRFSTDSIIDRALTREVEQGNLIVTNDRLREVIAGMPAFQEDGKFSIERYRAYVTSQGLTEPQFEERVRADLRKQMLVQAVLESAIVPSPGGRAHRSRAAGDSAKSGSCRSAPTRTLRKVAVADAQVAEFYEKNRKDFETPENVKVEYLVLSADAIAGGGTGRRGGRQVATTSRTRAATAVEEQRRASHILITPEGGDKAAARKKAEGILAALKAESGRLREDCEGAVEGSGFSGPGR